MVSFTLNNVLSGQRHRAIASLTRVCLECPRNLSRQRRGRNQRFKVLFLQRARADGGEREESNARERRRRRRVGLASKMWLDKIGAQRIDLLLFKAATNPLISGWLLYCLSTSVKIGDRPPSWPASARSPGQFVSDHLKIRSIETWN